MNEKLKQEKNNLLPNKVVFPKRVILYLIFIVVSLYTIDYMLSSISWFLLEAWNIQIDSIILFTAWLLLVLLVVATKIVVISMKQIITMISDWEKEKYGSKNNYVGSSDGKGVNK
ncbi:hypothetical protein R6Z02_14790 [Carnobacterium maltaromaticum]|uniref:hypothetical protein n=1 Tax=Carnobacterium maltaromaticum TaxID=2751 RepID=UPI00298BBD76|nr:hypothetical protein [Carnobacterium maltaromaticum]MDW5525021.1 hypothetical protein [Carnobacterium maltaromaticum]